MIPATIGVALERMGPGMCILSNAKDQTVRIFNPEVETSGFKISRVKAWRPFEENANFISFFHP